MNPGQSSGEAARLIDTVRRQLGQGQARSAIPACQQLNQHYPDVAEGWFVSSLAALHLGGAGHALECVRRALALEPGIREWQQHEARCLLAAHRRADSLERARRLAALEQSDWRLCADLALLLSDLQEFEAARHLFLRSIELEPGVARLYYNLATVQRYLGDLDGAAASCQAAIDLDPRDTDAQFLRSSLAKATESSHHLDELNGLLDSKLDTPLAEAQVAYALAKELEDLGRYPESFKALERGARARRGALDYDLDGDLALIDRIIEVYGPDRFIDPPAGADSQEPLFVVGLPRTGTTLVERIIGAHPEVYSAGELTDFTRQMIAGARRLAQAAPAAGEDEVALTARLDFRALGEAYLASTRPATGQTARFIDKFPQNALYLGLIHLALPRAKMVVLERHPLDTCFAMYKQLFTDIYQYSYDLDELGRYFVAYHRIMDHWRRCLPEAIHTVRYEDLVDDLEREARALLTHCGLDWNPAVLAFHHNPQASTTASASQVRQPIYATSVGRWRNYRDELADLAERLEREGCLEGWED